MTLLSASLDAALASGRSGELEQVSKEIEQAQGQVGQIDQLYLKLLHQVLAFQRAAEQRLVAK